MEASEKPQLPLDQPADDGAVRALDDRLVIQNLTITDERAARVVRDRAKAGRPAAETVTKAVEIGARVLDTEETAANVDYVRAEFERHAGALRRDLTKVFESSDENMAERIAASFDAGREGSVPQEIEDRVKGALVEQREALLKLFSAQEGSNPLFDFKDAMVRVYKELGTRQQAEGEENRKVISDLRREIVELKERDSADRRVADEAERGTAKGRTFEELVYAQIDRIAEGRGDAAHHVGDASSESGAKKGDVVVEIDGAAGACSGRLVIEVKNKKLSKNDAWAELNAAMAERDATFALLVVAGEDKVPSGLQEVTEYQGNKMIVALDRDQPDPAGVALAYRYARARAVMSTQGDLVLDASRVRDTAEQAAAALKRANAIRKALTGVRKGEETARDQLEQMIAEVERCLTSIEAIVAEAE
jgi:hypothetical protein